MIFGESWVAVLFRFLNFASVCALIVYLFKTKARAVIKKMMTSYSDALSRLRVQSGEMEKRKKDLDQHLVSDQTMQTRLKERVEMWAQIVDQHSTQRQKEKKERTVVLEKYAMECAQRYARNRLRRSATPRVIDESTKQLQKVYESEKESQLFLQAIMNRMRVGKS